MGHSRTAIYLSGLIVCFISSVIVCLSSVVIICAMGIPMFGLLTKPLVNTLAMIGTGILIVAAYAAVFTFIAMLISNKPITAVTCIVTCLILYFGSMNIGMKLDEPEISSGYEWIEDGELVSSLPHPNPFIYEAPKGRFMSSFTIFFPPDRVFSWQRRIQRKIRLSRYSFPCIPCLSRYLSRREESWLSAERI